jgi:ABC-type glycerol-3-phosphate transport system permease component
MVITSIKTGEEAWSMPPVFLFKPTFEAYVNILTGRTFFYAGRFYQAIWNSICIAVTATGLSLFLGSLGAYSLSRFQFKAKKPLAFMILASRLLPPVATVIPLFYVMNLAGLLDTQLSLILIYNGFNVPIAIWMLRGFFDEIPVEVEQSAMVDGCSRLSAFVRVVLPLTGPGLAATAIFLYIISWNDFLIALIFTGNVAKTIPVLVGELIGETGIYWPDMAATGLIVVIPVLIFSFIVQKHLVKGLTLGAVKR